MGTQYQPPMPRENERPAVYADRVGQWFTAFASVDDRKVLGQYLTPVEVADFMAGFYKPVSRCVRVLDPGAGAGVLSCALCEALATGRDKPTKIQLEAYEIDARLAGCLEACLSYTKQWLHTRGISLTFSIHVEDFVMAQAEALDELPRLFPTERDEKNSFNLIIANPPYFKIPKSDPRAQAVTAVVHGQPNIYALFMAIAASLLKSGGELIFITPRSYAAGPYFRLFRERLFASMQPRAIHLFGSRRETFGRDEVLQESMILQARRSDAWWEHHKEERVEVSHSIGSRDLSKPRKRQVALAEILDWRSKDKVLRIPTVEEADWVARIVQSWTGRLHTYGLEISTGPVVPFRAVPFISPKGSVPETHAPLLWMQSVTPMKVQWPTAARGKEQYIVITEESMRLLVANKNYVLLRRFSAKEAHRRLIAAPFLAKEMSSPLVGLENHLNYVHRPGGSLSEEETYGLAALFNSALLDTYFRTYNGNTQVSATELRAMPLPPLEVITEIGRRVIAVHNPVDIVDALIEEVIHGED